MDIEQEIQAIRERNVRVESDKAWETSVTRRLSIAGATYLIASVWLIIIDGTNVWLKAVVPTGGYLLSTLSLPYVKCWWLRNYRKK